MIDKKLVNQELKRFWNMSIALTPEQKEEMKQYKDMDAKELVPSPKLFEASKLLGKCKKVLDYGCGTAWAAIVANKYGCKDVTAVDLGEDIIDSANYYADLCDAKINSFAIDPDWLVGVNKETYDGIVCSNVLDVVPLETAKEIIERLARVATKDALIIIGLNFYMPPEVAAQRGMSLQEGKYLFVDNVLRLLSLSDDEWKDLLTPYFDIQKLEYFAWPGEQKETRRLFILRKR